MMDEHKTKQFLQEHWNLYMAQESTLAVHRATARITALAASVAAEQVVDQLVKAICEDSRAA